MWLTYSILAAIGFGLRGILYHWTSQKPLSRNALLCGTFTMGAVINLALALLTDAEWTAACLIGIQMGLFSFGANASMFKGFAVGKASLVAILTALPSVVVVAVAYLLWDERLYAMQLVSFLVIVGGVLLVRYSNDLSLRNLQGAQWGLLAMLLFAGNDLSGKWSTIMEASLYPTMVMMFTSGAACFGLWWLKDLRMPASGVAGTVVIAAVETSGPKGDAASPARWSDKRAFFVGMAIGITNTVGMMLIITAFDLGKAGLVSAVVAANVLLMLLYTRFVVKEKFKSTELAGIVLAFAGLVLMRLFGE
ncbi:EamA family transporter [Paenibacillus soyae]|uniref:EamA family transporter n=1 Tax=Paenibacillus soyae TaxID=2969249 RepID=A0A9X2SBB6_9BACL|nr:EamA family transporter [Paenibacillus soyae]MCR2804652.1 EamA family transporter [Paenibacillus soyae]